MNEIFVEEENTVYELDPECLKRKEERKKWEEQRNNDHKIQKMSKCQNNCNLFIVVCALWILCQ